MSLILSGVYDFIDGQKRYLYNFSGDAQYLIKKVLDAPIFHIEDVLVAMRDSGTWCRMSTDTESGVLKYMFLGKCEESPMRVCLDKESSTLSVFCRGEYIDRFVNCLF